MTTIDETVRAEHVCDGCAHGPAMSRRRVLAGGAALVGVGVLAACGSGGADGADPQTGAGGGAEEASGGADGGTDGLVALADVPVGGAVLVTASVGDVLVAQPEEGTVVAFSAVCTHQGCTVQAEDTELVCPCHGSVFAVGTGEARSGPATRGLDEVAVEVRDGQVVET